MDPPRLVTRARAVWESRARGAAAFSPAARVAVCPESGLCPPGWAGVVSIAGSVIATAPGPAEAAILQRGLGEWPAAVVAVAHALGRGLLPQWRAVPPASRRVAAALGFRELGWQASILLRT
ncbi:MAG TPA: hypothetical protein VGM79_12135 [Streptosporangiaceae bacterium]|jgi:hypothetical protein